MSMMATRHSPMPFWKHVPPAAIRRKLLELKLLEEKRGSLFATTQGRDVLKLVDAHWRGGYKWCPPRKV